MRLLLWLLALGVIGALLAAGVVAIVIWQFSRDLPTLDSAADYDPPQVTRVYSTDGEVIASWTDSRRLVRTVLPHDEIPDVMRHAILAAEDSSFYQHQGLDYVGLARAMYTNVRRGSMAQGASTITQQVVKNLVLSPERSLRRKVQEALLAFRLERALSKDEILTIYLNEIFFGVHFYGVEEASQYFFGHSARELALHEAALLAGLVQSPNRYNPYRYPDRAMTRRGYVLRQMYQKGFIEEGVYRAAVEAPLGLVPHEERRPLEGRFLWYTDAVRRELERHIGVEQLETGGLRIHTALDSTLQALAEDALQEGLRAFDGRHGFHTPFRRLDGDDAVARWRQEHANDVEAVGLDPELDYRAVILRSDDDGIVMGIGPFEVALQRTPESRLRPDPQTPWAELFPPRTVFTVRPLRRYPVDELRAAAPGTAQVRLLPSAQGALVAIDPSTREVRALVGGYDFRETPFNRAVQARRQVGSSFKPFIYAAAIDAGVATPATVFQDQPTAFRQPDGRTWNPQNFDGQYRGPMSMRTALALSRNVIAVRVLDLVGLERARAFLERAGVEGLMSDNLTLALGSAEMTPLEMTAAFATFADEGRVLAPTLVRRVEDPRGGVVWQPERAARQGMSPEAAWLTGSMMRSVVERGTGRAASRVGHPVAGKTGTTNSVRDAWFVGYSPGLVAGVWVGYDSNDPLGRREGGGQTALPVWTEFMRRALRGREVTPFPEPPAGVVQLAIDEASGLRARPGRRSVTEYFLQGTAPTDFASYEEDRGVLDTLLHGGGDGAAPLDGAVFDDSGF